MRGFCSWSLSCWFLKLQQFVESNVIGLSYWNEKFDDLWLKNKMETNPISFHPMNEPFVRVFKCHVNVIPLKQKFKLVERSDLFNYVTAVTRISRRPKANPICDHTPYTP